MPTVDPRTGEHVSEIEVAIPDALAVHRVVVRHGEVSLFDAQGRESMLITRGTHPGAGMNVQFADHVSTTPAPSDASTAADATASGEKGQRP